MANVLVFSFYFERYSVSELFERFLNKNKIPELELPKIPDLYNKNILLLNFEKNVKDKEDFVEWKSLIYKKFIEIYDFKNIDKPTLKNVKVESTKNIDSNILTKFSAKAFDGRGNYTLGIPDYTIFPEVELDKVQRALGFDVCIVTSANSDDEARELLHLLGMPFRGREKKAA